MAQDGRSPDGHGAGTEKEEVKQLRDRVEHSGTLSPTDQNRKEFARTIHNE
jgi:hypothetical protein